MSVWQRLSGHKQLRINTQVKVYWCILKHNLLEEPIWVRKAYYDIMK